MRTKILLAFISSLCSVFCVPSTLLRTDLDSAFAFCYEEAGHEYNINPVLLRAISKTESNLDYMAVSMNSNGTHDIGLMQINSSWVKSLNLNPDLLLSDPCYNLKTGSEILSKCIDQYGYSWEAVGCFNASSKDKRVKYSWKIFEQLKSGVGSQNKEDEKIRSWEIKNLSSSQPHNFSTSKIKDSEFFFSIRDKTQTGTEEK